MRDAARRAFTVSHSETPLYCENAGRLFLEESGNDGRIKNLFYQFNLS